MDKKTRDALNACRAHLANALICLSVAKLEPGLNEDLEQTLRSVEGADESLEEIIDNR